MEVPSLLALNAGHRAIGDSLVGLSIQRYPNRKAPGPAVSDDLNATNGLAARPMPHGLKAFFAERPVVQADRFEFHHLKTIMGKRPRILTSEAILRSGAYGGLTGGWKQGQPRAARRALR
jgi:hypothetical protein